MLTLEHEDEDHKEEKTCFSQEDSVPVLESFIFLTIRKVFQSAAVCLSCWFPFLVSHVHRKINQPMRKGSYFNKLVNGFV